LDWVHLPQDGAQWRAVVNTGSARLKDEFRNQLSDYKPLNMDSTPGNY